MTGPGDDKVIGPRVRAVENMVARARAKTGSKAGGPACVNCRMTLWLSFFFDGTGNHRDRDFPRKHSNVAALYDAHVNSARSGVLPFYYEGIGTEFEFKGRHERKPTYSRGGAVQWVDVNGYRESESTFNKGFGSGLETRLEKAIFEFQVAVERQRGLTRVDEINVSAFGFSRGATEARAFVNWLANHSKVKTKGGKLSYDGIPMNVKFLGLFDTVESVGGAGSNKRPEIVKTSLPTFVQKCLHIVAAHELRGAFPLTVLGTNRYTQVVYPGAHANIGGGYADGEQGRSDKLARIALLQMLDHARGAGLKMLSIDEMRASTLWTTRYKASFDVPSEATAALKNYMKHVKSPGPLMGDAFDAHMQLYWAWIDAGLALEDAEVKRGSAKAGSKESTETSLRTMAHLLRYSARTKAGRGVANSLPLSGAIPAAVEALFETYVHDSFEHFSVSGGTLMTDMSIADYYERRELHLPRA